MEVEMVVVVAVVVVVLVMVVVAVVVEVGWMVVVVDWDRGRSCFWLPVLVAVVAGILLLACGGLGKRNHDCTKW